MPVVNCISIRINVCMPLPTLFFYSLKIHQEYNNLKKLGDSLLTRSTKLNELISKIESEIESKSDSKEKKRAEGSMSQNLCLYLYPGACKYLAIDVSSLRHPRSVKSLESAVNILQGEIESVEQAKVEVSELKSAKDSKAAGISEPSPHSIPMKAAESQTYIHIFSVIIYIFPRRVSNSWDFLYFQSTFSSWEIALCEKT